MSSAGGVPDQQVVGVADHGGDQLAVDRRPGPVGPELGRAVDHGDADGPGGVEQPGGVRDHADPGGGLGQLREGAQVADHAALDLHGEHGAPVRCGQVARSTGTGPGSQLPDRAGRAHEPDDVRAPPLSDSSGASATIPAAHR